MRGGKDYNESSRLGDKYSDDYFNELKHANQWRMQNETMDSNLLYTGNEDGLENKENHNYYSNSVKALVDDIETSITGKKVKTVAPSISQRPLSTSNNKSTGQPSHNRLRSASADPRSRRGHISAKSAEHPTKSECPQRARRALMDGRVATSSELQQMHILGETIKFPSG